MKSMRYPAFIRENDCIGFPAPSFGCNIEPYRSSFDHAQTLFQAMGFRTLCGPNAYAGDGIGISSSPESCGKELTELMCEILEHVDFDQIAKAPPKWFMGYSDNTNFTFLLTTLCDTASVYGPCAASFGMSPWHPAIEDAFRLLRGEKLESEGYPLYEISAEKDEANPLAPYHCTEERKIVAFDPAEGFLSSDNPLSLAFSGRLLGGCLDILATLCGTEYDRVAAFTEHYREDGFLWFLEACDLNVFSIRRALWQLKKAGWFRYVKGFLIGRPLAGREPLMGLEHLRAVTEPLASCGVPILLDVDLGHLPPMIPMISGSLASVSYTPPEDRFRIRMELR